MYNKKKKIKKKKIKFITRISSIVNSFIAIFFSSSSFSSPHLYKYHFINISSKEDRFKRGKKKQFRIN